MATSNQPAWFTNLPSAPTKTPKQVQEGQAITKGGIDIQTETAKAPFAGPQAETNLKKDRLQVIRDAKTYGRDLRKEFDATEAVKVYREGMRYFTTALRTPANSAGDQDLVTLAAKVQDPTGAVMQGDIERYNNIQVALERLPAAFSNEFLRTGKFSEKTRKDIRTFITNRVLVQRDAYNDARKSYVTDIEDFNAQTGDLGVKPLDPATVLGTHPATLYKDKILAYDATQKAGDKVAERSGLLSTPDGMRIAGEDVKGFRFSPEAESSINAYTKSEGATAEGYAKMLADAAVKEGFIDEAQRGNYEAQTALDNAETFKLPPAQRGGIDYKAIDEAASKDAGLLETVAQQARNLPESAAQLVTGLGGMIANPVETFNTTTDLVGALLQGDADDPTLKAAATMLEEQYGGADNIKRYMIKDPLAFLGDASLLLGGSGFVLKAGGLTKVGEAVSKAGRVIDPLSAAGALVTDVPAAAYQKAKEVAPNVVTGVERLPGEVAGFLPGVGGASVDAAASAGFARGRAGAPTEASEAFTDAMRNPERTAEDVVASAQGIVAKMREQASQRYTDAMQKFGRTPTPLGIDKIEQRMQQLKPKSYDTWSSRKGERPSDHIAWEKMNAFVNEYAQKAAADPSLLLPLSMDQFKRDVYDIGSKINGAVDSKAAGIAKQTYNAVRQELVRHDPVYADIMRDYEKGVNEAQQLEKSFSLGSAASVDTSARKLQSIFRNNVNTGFGARTAQAERMFEMDPSGVLEKTLAGQTVSAFPPRGISKVSPALGNATLLAAPLFSPRAVGEMAYGAGRVAGTGARAFDTIAGSKVGQGLGDFGTGLAELYQKYPELFLAGTQVGTMLDKIDAQALADKYVGAPVVPAGDVAAEEPITVTGTRNPSQGIADLADSYGIAPAAVAPVAEPAVPKQGIVMFGDKEVKYDPASDTYIEIATGRRVKNLDELVMPEQAMYRGGTVRAFKNGGDKGEKMKNQSSYGANLLRQIGEGVSFGNAAETEALLRAGFMTPEYYALLKDLENRRSNWAKQNPKAALAADLGGSLVPGVLGAFVPGPGWAATASTGARVASVLPRVARALDAPAEALLRRAAPNALNAVRQSGLGRTAVTVADEVLNGALRSVGEAPSLSEIPKQVKDDLAKNTAMALGARTATSGGRRVVRKIRGK
jgi:hypothetical protein